MNRSWCKPAVMAMTAGSLLQLIPTGCPESGFFLAAVATNTTSVISGLIQTFLVSTAYQAFGL